MLEPPVDAGAVQFATACNPPPAAPCVPAEIPGTPGTVAGVTLADAADNALDPTALTACNRKLYAVPFVNPSTAVEFIAWFVTAMVSVRTTVVPLRTCNT